jgi:hypothetical protein
MKNIVLHIDRGEDQDPEIVKADVATSESDPALWLRAARDCAWTLCLHHGAAITVVDPDDSNAPVVRVSCEWLEGEEA